ncbi:MAG: HlyC/CorC family transporter [Phycisphaerales bacterium]|nr:HlyC/CorC family transporter [Phycisphaerales bacterium]
MTIGPIEIILLLSLLPVAAISAFGSCSETVLFGLRQSDREKLRRERPVTGRRVDELLREPRGLLLTVLFINMTSNTLYFVICSGILLMSNVSPWVELLFALSTLAVLVIAGETLPKIVGNVARIPLAGFVSGPLILSHRILSPIRRVLEIGIVLPLSRLVGVAPKDGISMTDVQELVRQNSKSGVLRFEEAGALRRVIRLQERQVGDLMTARVFIAWIRSDATYAQVFAAVQASRRNRLIVADPDLDHIAGYLDVRSFLLDSRGVNTPLDAHIRKIGFVPELATVGQLLEWFQREGERSAVVVDEFGGTAGVVSLRDAVGEIAGEMASEWENEPTATLDAGGWWRMPGDMDLCLALDRLQMTLPESESATLGGFVMEHLNRVPQANDSLVTHGLEMIVESMERNRVLWIKVRRAESCSQDFKQ